MSSLSPPPLTDAAIAAVISAATIGNAMAGASLGAVGTVALMYSNQTTQAAGSTAAASTLKYASAGSPADQATLPAGTWRCLGFVGGGGQNTLWRRIA